MRQLLTRRDWLRAASLAALPLARAADSRPNILWIWCDNLAYEDLGIYSGDETRSPVINRLARQGVRFTQYYIAHTVCSPSRAALLTGRQPFRCGVVDVLRPDGPSGLPEDEITLGQALRDLGYATQAIGKWHLGDRREFLPTRRGFDHYFGIPYSMDMLPTIVYRDEEIVDNLDGAKVETITERYTDEAIRFVTEKRERPFFLYFSHTIPHPPLNLPARVRRPGHSIYDDAIAHMDAETGRFLDALEKHGLTENTLIFFSSDNGPMGAGGQTGRLRGRIRDAYEGGIRVPLIARWPGHIPENRVVEAPAIAYDIFPTLMRVANGALPAGRVYDGQDILPLLTGDTPALGSGTGFNRIQPFFWIYLDNVTTVRHGRWKLHVAQRNETLPEPELYDVEADPEESRNLATAHPEEVRRLKELIAGQQRQVPKVWGLQYPVRDPAKLPGGVRRQ